MVGIISLSVFFSQLIFLNLVKRLKKTKNNQKLPKTTLIHCEPFDPCPITEYPPGNIAPLPFESRCSAFTPTAKINRKNGPVRRCLILKKTVLYCVKRRAGASSGSAHQILPGSLPKQCQTSLLGPDAINQLPHHYFCLPTEHITLSAAV
jgi:hypothetical protein